MHISTGFRAAFAATAERPRGVLFTFSPVQSKQLADLEPACTSGALLAG